MKSKLSLIWENLRSSYWFLPLIFSLFGYLLQLGTIYLDTHLDKRWLEILPWKNFSSSSAAQQFLSAIVGAIMTLIGIVFSLTIVALIMASSHYGLRLLRNFMKDMKTQIVLGVFVATFIYCIMAFRSIREGPESAFIPHITIMTALAMTLLSIVFLIFYIHHISVRIQAPTVIAEISKELLWSIDLSFPEIHEENLPSDQEREASWAANTREDEGYIFSVKQSGYLQAIDWETLTETTKKHDIRLELYIQQGDFLLPDQCIGRTFSKEKISESLRCKLLDSLILGTYRTTKQDVKFAFEQMVEVAQKALSPGINEPLVAMMCMDYLTLALIRILKRPDPSGLRLDGDKIPRIKIMKSPFSQIFTLAFGTVAHYADSPSLILVILERTRQISEHTRTIEEKQALKRLAELMSKRIDDKTWSPESKRHFEECAARI